jgi:endonuclease-3
MRTPLGSSERWGNSRTVRTGAQDRARILNPFTLLVAVVLSAQATDVGVNKATRALFAIADTPPRCWRSAKTGRDYIKTIGLYRNKAKNVIALSKS